VSVAAFISSQRTVHNVPHAVTCRALGLSQSGCNTEHAGQTVPSGGTTVYPGLGDIRARIALD
jgi:hypothetical protein